MVKVRTSSDRGHFDFGWLNTYHSFSFGDYYDPQNMGYRSLRVINEDVVQPGKGFGTHPHKNMEILTYVLSGSLAHKDSTGNAEQLGPGEVQRMTAGTGIFHSEFNASSTEPVHLLQIWIMPEKTSLEPGYEQFRVPDEELSGTLRLIASREGGKGVAVIHQDARVYAGRLPKGTRASVDLAAGRGAWVQVARGRAKINGTEVKAGDGAVVEGDPKVEVESLDASELLVFDLK
jgi:redox-sensitive bicupin YhaK (pirin superfamily)